MDRRRHKTSMRTYFLSEKLLAIGLVTGLAFLVFGGIYLFVYIVELWYATIAYIGISHDKYPLAGGIAILIFLTGMMTQKRGRAIIWDNVSTFGGIIVLFLVIGLAIFAHIYGITFIVNWLFE